MMQKLFHYASPQNFYPLAGKLWPVFALAGAVLSVWGLWLGMFVAPTDFQQGEGYRIIFVHVPVSWMSMIIYLAMAFWALLGLTFNTRLSGMMGKALAPTGAMFAFLSLWTGALWGKPMWGTWWVWDARLTSVLILFFFYAGYIALYNSYENKEMASKISSILALVGFINIPIIKFSVDWWNTLHQPASILRKGGVAIDGSMLKPLMLMFAGFAALFVSVLIIRVKTALMAKKIDRKLNHR